MKMTGRLFLGRKFLVGRAEISDSILPVKPACFIRVFCKADNIDRTIPVITDDQNAFMKNRTKFSVEIESWRILETLSGKKVFLQYREEPGTPAIKPGGKYLSVPYRLDEPSGGFSARIILDPGMIGGLFRILGTKPPEDPLTAGSLGKLDRAVFRKLSEPPPDFDEIILSLGDTHLQRLLQNLLHRNIASPEMLAAYIRGLGDNGQVLLDNLARGVRQEIAGLVRAARISSTYRWIDEVNYIIKRNLMIAVRELGLDVRGMELTTLLRYGYEAAVAREQLSSKGIESWLEEFSDKGMLRELINNTERRTLASALTFCRPADVERLFGEIISRDGIRILTEDVEAARVYPETDIQTGLIRFLRIVKDLYFTPVVKKLDFESETMNGIRDDGALDLIVDETGFAKTVYALKNMPEEWLSRTVTGVFRSIFEDVTGDRITIKGFSNARIPESRLDFLKAMYILADEEKI